MTIKKFYEENDLTEYEAKIIEIIAEKDHFRIITDATIFYPEGGGQPSDHGTINGIEVFDVQEKDGVIYHYMKEKPTGEAACMKIDWERRYDFMQQHTGEHVLSGMIHSEYGGNNRGFHLGAQLTTIDIDIPQMSRELLREIEQKVNRKISEDIAVRADITDRERLSEHTIRKEVSAKGDIRVITIDGADCCACCGIHVKSLAEVKFLKIIKTEQYKGMTRIGFVCGDRAVADYNRRFEITEKLRRELNADDEHITERVIRMKEESEEMKHALYGQKLLFAKYLAKDLMREQNKNIFKIFDDVDFDTLLHIGEQIEKQCDCSVLASALDGRLIATATTTDLGILFREELRRFGGKGGGKGKKAQAMFDDRENQYRFVEFLKQKIQ